MLSLRKHVTHFIQVKGEEADQPYEIPRGEDPTGKLKDLRKLWRINPRLRFFRRQDTGQMTRSTSACINVGDFVEVICHLDLITDERKGQIVDEVRVGLAMEEIHRLFNAEQLAVSYTVIIQLYDSPMMLIGCSGSCNS